MIPELLHARRQHHLSRPAHQLPLLDREDLDHRYHSADSLRCVTISGEANPGIPGRGPGPPSAVSVSAACRALGCSGWDVQRQPVPISCRAERLSSSHRPPPLGARSGSAHHRRVPPTASRGGCWPQRRAAPLGLSDAICLPSCAWTPLPGLLPSCAAAPGVQGCCCLPAATRRLCALVAYLLRIDAATMMTGARCASLWLRWPDMAQFALAPTSRFDFWPLSPLVEADFRRLAARSTFTWTSSGSTGPSLAAAPGANGIIARRFASAAPSMSARDIFAGWSGCPDAFNLAIAI